MIKTRLGCKELLARRIVNVGFQVLGGLSMLASKFSVEEIRDTM
jgi:hypothetical protein